MNLEDEELFMSITIIAVVQALNHAVNAYVGCFAVPVTEELAVLVTILNGCAG